MFVGILEAKLTDFSPLILYGSLVTRLLSVRILMLKVEVSAGMLTTSIWLQNFESSVWEISNPLSTSKKIGLISFG